MGYSDLVYSPIRSIFVSPNPVGGAPQGGAGFNAMAAGNRVYGGGAPMPTSGMLANRAGYQQRDQMAAQRRNALLQRISKGY